MAHPRHLSLRLPDVLEIYDEDGLEQLFALPQFFDHPTSSDGESPARVARKERRAGTSCDFRA
jgi:hypothetical protein